MTRPDVSGARPSRRNARLAAAVAFVTLIGVAAASPHALLSILLDLTAALFIVGPPVLAGLWLVPLIHRRPMPLRWHFALGAGLGLGVMSLLVLVLGMTGVLQRPVWTIMLGGCAVAGILRARQLTCGTRSGADLTSSTANHAPSETHVYLWLLVCPMLVLALLAASNAPGFIWQEEAFGYDVLEYHLQLPKEYLEAGRIAYLPHNAYANFPANVEMLYLLAMIVYGHPQDAGTVANMIHLILAALAVYAAWVAGREWSPVAGSLSAVAMATAGWLPYLCGLAYVENGLLFFGMLATACLLRAVKVPHDGTMGGERATLSHDQPGSVAGHGGWLGSTGLMAGLACGCKYTGLPMIALPLGLAALLMPRRPLAGRFTDALLFATATLVALSPWLIKNQAFTGNPVFPLANTVFKASPQGWGPEETVRWNNGHCLSPPDRSLAGRLRLFWQHVLGDKDLRFGPAVFLLAVLALFKQRASRTDAVLWLMLLTQLAVWLFATHLYARFAVVMLIPLALLAARAVDGTRPRLRRTAVMAILFAGSAWNIVFAALLYARESPGGAPASRMVEGEVPGFEYLGTVNRHLPVDAKVLLVGDARAFYFERSIDYGVVFNRNPFLQVLRDADSPDDVLHWLRDNGYTHVLVHWGELMRLASTYGLSPAIDPVDVASWFDRMADVGLIRVQAFPHPQRNLRFVDVYEIPRRSPRSIEHLDQTPSPF